MPVQHSYTYSACYNSLLSCLCQNWLWIVAFLQGNTGYTQKNGAVSKLIKKFISHLTWAQRTPSAAATVQVSHTLITVLQCVHPGSHDTHPHGNQIQCCHQTHEVNQVSCLYTSIQFSQTVGTT